MEILPYLDRLWLGEGFDANAADPRGLWAVWDEYGIQGTEFLPFTLEDLPCLPTGGNLSPL